MIDEIYIWTLEDPAKSVKIVPDPTVSASIIGYIDSEENYDSFIQNLKLAFGGLWNINEKRVQVSIIQTFSTPSIMQ